MKILGISPADVWLSSAALLEDGKITAAAAEERFDRQKMSKAFPVKAIDYCLREAKIEMADLDHIVMAWNPAIHIKSASQRYLSSIRWRGEYLYSVPSYILNQFTLPEVSHVEQRIHLKGKEMPITFINHHDAHAANAFFMSPYNEAAILTVDGRGENDTCLFAKGKGNQISRIKSVTMPHSLGLFYATLTDYLGFKPHSDEWKVMALASYGKRNNKYYKKVKELIKLKKDGEFELDLTYFTYYFFDKQPTMYSDKLIKLLGPQRRKEDKITQRHIDIANALQQIYEEVVTCQLRYLYKVTGSKNLTVSGGCAMNSVFNGKMKDVSGFKNVFVSSCPDDSGTSIGATLFMYNSLCGHKKRFTQQHNYWGPSYSNEEIKDVLDKYKVKYKYSDKIENVTAGLISEGKLVGWFQGRMEFGQRALGSRSILADPRDEKTKDFVNSAVKYREGFRPFAPAILEGNVSEYFDLPKGFKVPFMEKVYMVKRKMRHKIPAVVHVDGSGRLQTVSRSQNPIFYRLINEFKKISGVPVVLNTSYNLNGEPIVCSPTDAIRTFNSCGLDCLAIGNYIVTK